MTAPVELVRELLHYRDMKMIGGRDWGMITALVAGSSIAFPMLAPVAVGSLMMLGVHTIAKARRRKIAGIVMPRVPRVENATTIVGIARKFRQTVESLVDRAPVLVEHAIVRDRSGDVLLRRAESAPFLLETEGRPVLVTGATRVSLLGLRDRVKRGDPRLERMGVPGDLAIAGELEISSLEEGPEIAVTGLVEEESVAELAFHRDGGRVKVMRGRPGAPVMLADRRLIGALI